MRADGVVNVLPVAEFAIEFFHLQRARRDLVELLGVGAIGAFDGAVELRLLADCQRPDMTGCGSDEDQNRGIQRLTRMR